VNSAFSWAILVAISGFTTDVDVTTGVVVVNTLGLNEVTVGYDEVVVTN